VRPSNRCAPVQHIVDTVGGLLKQELKKCAHPLAVFSFGVLTLISWDRSQQGTTQQSEIQRALDARFKQLELKIGAVKAEWRQNEPIVVSVYLINNGKGHVNVAEHGVWADYQISLVDGNIRPEWVCR
jgi:hypothetical protein